MKKTVLSTMAISSIFVLLSGCSSHNVAIAPTQPENYEVLGKAEGKGSG